MPPTEKHVATSRRRAGQDYAELHNWIDDPVHKNDRHDFSRIWENGLLVRERFGEEGVREYIEHLRQDMETKLWRKVPGGPPEELRQACHNFGLGQSLVPEISKSDPAPPHPPGLTRNDLDHTEKMTSKIPAMTLQPM
jgi:hypothetical protein